MTATDDVPLTEPAAVVEPTVVDVPRIGQGVLAWQAKWAGHCAAGDLIEPGQWITRLASLAVEQGGATYHARCAHTLPVDLDPFDPFEGLDSL